MPSCVVVFRSLLAPPTACAPTCCHFRTAPAARRLRAGCRVLRKPPQNHVEMPFATLYSVKQPQADRLCGRTNHCERIVGFQCRSHYDTVMDCLGVRFKDFAVRLLSRCQCLQRVTVFLLPSSLTAMLRLPEQPVLGSARFLFDTSTVSAVSRILPLQILALTYDISCDDKCAAQRPCGAVCISRSSGTQPPGNARKCPAVTGATPHDHGSKKKLRPRHSPLRPRQTTTNDNLTDSTPTTAQTRCAGNVGLGRCSVGDGDNRSLRFQSPKDTA